MTTKRRYLRPVIEDAMIYITMFLFVLIACIDDFELSAIPVIASMIGLVILNICVLKKYGRGRWHD